MKSTQAKTRSHTHEFEIGADADTVWRAITDARELTRWFPLQAEVTPGAGGVIRYRWGDMEGACRIETWEPGRHLRTAWMAFANPAGSTDEERRQLAVDWFLDGRGGRTVLRLVHSGFSPDRSWDDEYDGTRRGWAFELRSLRHYLENHAGKERHAFWLRQPTRLPASQVWALLTQPGGFVSEGRIDVLAPGSTYRLTLRSGDVLEGRVEILDRPHDFAASVDNLGRGLFRLGHEACAGGPEAVLWLSTWGQTASAVETLRQRWSHALAETFAGEAP